jgi:glycosyltransferase involved in cell wall biosynthesis
MLNMLLDRGAQNDTARVIRVEELSSKLAAVLYLPRTPESISYRPYLDTVGSVRLLEWFLDRFFSTNPRIKLNVLYHTENEVPQLRDILQHYNVHPVPTSHKLQTQAFLQVVEETRKLYTALFTIEMGFSPVDLLRKAFLHHLKHKNKFTFVTGLPANCIPEIYESNFLTMVCGIRVPNRPQTPRAIIESSLIASHNKTSFTKNRLSRLVVTALSKVISTSFTSIPFNASDIYDGDTYDLPEIVRIDGQNHVEIARDVVRLQSLCSAAEKQLTTLYLWKTASMQKHHSIRVNLVKTLNAPTSDFVDKKCKRVLFVSNLSGYSGAGECLCQLIGGLDPKQYEAFALIGVSGFFTERLRKFGAQVITNECEFSSTSVNNFLFVLSTLKKVLPDVIHINGESGMPIVLAAKLLGIPLIFHLRVSSGFEHYEDSLKTSDAIIAVSEFVKREASKKDIDKNRIRVIFDGVDTQHFSRKHFDKAAMRKEFGLPQNARIVLNIARFAKNKRHDLLIAASEIARKSIRDLHLILVGETEGDDLCHGSVVEQISKAGLDRHVTFLGFQRDIRKIEAAADALVLCSDREPLGTCLMEAMAMELPVVVTDSGGSHELFKHGVTGLKTPGGNVSELASKMVEILTNRELAERIAYSAREFAETELSIQLHADKISEVYEETTEKMASMQYYESSY